jgi:thioester reductase-like protein
MPASRVVLLTGATGFLGRYLLRDLLLSGQRVAVLARDSRDGRAENRIKELLNFWGESLGRPLPCPVVLHGDLSHAGLGFSPTDRNWLARNCQTVVHAAANLSFRSAPDGEPWNTNVNGTKALLQVAAEMKIPRWHQISTAFVCGKRTGLIQETELDHGQQFHNPYEKSKCEAEICVREAEGICATIYRPSVIVGDGRTGYTSSYVGFYRFLELANRLANLEKGQRRLPVRLRLRGDEPCDLVPVDWVSRAVVELLARPSEHGRTYHLVSPLPATARFIQETASAELDIDGIELIGPKEVESPTRLEEMLLEGLQEYWPYLGGTPDFCHRNTTAELPHLPAPIVDAAMLRRLVRFAVANRFGRGPSPNGVFSQRSTAMSCSAYFEQVFPERARASSLARDIGLTTLVSFDIHGAGGGQWSCHWEAGELMYVRRGLDERAVAIYRTDTATFEDVVQGRQNPQQAFFEERIAISGDLETALKLAALFHQFLQERATVNLQRTETVNAACS